MIKKEVKSFIITVLLIVNFVIFFTGIYSLYSSSFISNFFGAVFIYISLSIFLLLIINAKNIMNQSFYYFDNVLKQIGKVTFFSLFITLILVYWLKGNEIFFRLIPFIVVAAGITVVFNMASLASVVDLFSAFSKRGEKRPIYDKAEILTKQDVQN